MSSAPQQADVVPELVPRLTPSVAQTIRAAAESVAASASGQPSTACGLMIADSASGSEIVVDEIELLACEHGAGERLSAEEVAAVQQKIRQIRERPQRRIVGLLRTWSAHAPGFAVQENTTLTELLPECRWFFLARTFPDGRSRLRVFRASGIGWTQAADIELAAAAAHERRVPFPLRLAAVVVSLLGRIPPAVTAAVAALAILAVAWFCVRSSPVTVPADLGMRVGTDGSLLGVSWERQLPAVRSGKAGVLQIDDGGRHRVVRLDAGQVANGLVLYRPASDDVTFRLAIQGNGPQKLEGAVRWIDASGAMAQTAFAVNPEPPVPTAEDLVRAAHPSGNQTTTPDHGPAATPKLISDGLARFVVKTPNAHVTVRPEDHPHAPEQVVTAASMRLPSGRWTVHASAPGYHPWTGHFLVNRAGPADVFVRLRELHPSRSHRTQGHLRARK